MRSVVVTGVSTGIGNAVAHHLVGAGYRVFGSVRRESEGEALRAAWGERFTPLVFDVTDEEQVRAAAATVQAELAQETGEGLAGLVNNAGIAVAGPLLHLPLAELRQQLEVNVVAVVGVTQAFAPLLGAVRGAGFAPGRIVNMSSVSGRIAFPFIGAYAASKHALEAISDALRRELAIYGIEVIVLQPGAVQSPIWGKGRAMAAPYRETDYAGPMARYERIVEGIERGALPAARIAALVQRALEHPRPRPRYTPTASPLMSFWMLRLLPPRWIDAIIRRRMGLK